MRIANLREDLSVEKRFWLLALVACSALAVTGCNVLRGLAPQAATQPAPAASPGPTAAPTPQPVGLVPTPTPETSQAVPPTRARHFRPTEGTEAAAAAAGTPGPETSPAPGPTRARHFRPTEGAQIEAASTETAQTEAAPTAAPPPTAAPTLAPASTSTATLPAATDTLSPDLSPAATFVITADSVSVRQGPGNSFPSSGVAQKGDMGGVLGTNRDGSWLYVIMPNGTLGWLPADAVRLLSSPGEATALPPNSATPESTRPAAPTPTPQRQPTPAPLAEPAAEPLDITQLQPAASAQVDTDLLNLRQGPGPEYVALGTLRRSDRVTILALNRARDWALIKTADDKVAWAWLSLLTVTGDLSAAPQVISSPPGGDFPAGQVAPIFSETR